MQDDAGGQRRTTRMGRRDGRAAADHPPGDPYRCQKGCDMQDT